MKIKLIMTINPTFYNYVQTLLLNLHCNITKHNSKL